MWCDVSTELLKVSGVGGNRLLNLVHLHGISGGAPGVHLSSAVVTCLQLLSSVDKGVQLVETLRVSDVNLKHRALRGR